MLIDSANIQFKEYSQGMDSLFPCRLDENISSDAPVRLVNQIVDKLDISPLLSTYKGGGCPAYYPRMLLKVLFFAYLNNVYSCRKIARLLQENILYMWLSGKSTPDFRTINDFRSKRLKSCIHSLFTQIVLMLVELGYISLEKQYIDGTKMESAANRYTFVWRKSVEKYKDRLENKIQCILSQIDEGILGDNTAPGESTLPIDSHALKEKIDAINLENRNKRELRQIKKLNEEYLPKLQEYEKHLEIMGERNSYSKTDPDATFMRMKEDHMRNGQLKPGYNLQISTENQFITNYAFYHNPGDTLTLISFLLYGRMRYCRFMKEVCADAGYGSEENYEFMERFGISAYVKYNYFHMEQTKKWKCDISKQDNLYYNEPEDYFVCPMGQYMKFAYTIKAVNDNGYESEISVYRAKNCQGCPLQNKCHKGRGNREIKVNHKLRRYKQLAREKLTSSKGLEHRSKRPVEVEAVFGQIKWNKEYKRFRHKGLEKIVMDFGILAIAFNIGKMICKQKKAKKGRDGKDYKTDKGRKLSFMRGIFISCWINHKKRKKLEGTLFGHPLTIIPTLLNLLKYTIMDLQIIQNKIFEVRSCRVMLDYHLAELYQVETRALKQAVKRNIERFPGDFMFVLTQEEANLLLSIGVSQNVIPPAYNFGVAMPMAFTEQGVAMLSSVLRSKVAIEVNISIMRAFVLMRQMAIGYEELSRRIEELEVSTDAQFNELYQALTQLLSQSKQQKERRPVGFVTYNRGKNE